MMLLKKKIKRIMSVMSIILLLGVLVLPLGVSAEDTEKITYDNSLLLELNGDKIEQGKVYTASDFSGTGIKELLLFNNFQKDPEYIAVLNESGDNKKADAKEKLKSNSLISRISDNAYISHTPSCKLSSNSATVNVGDKFTLELLDYDFGFISGFVSNKIDINLKNFDKQKKYTLDDFSGYGFSEIEQSNPDSCIHATLSSSDIYSLARTINKLGSDSKVLSATRVINPTGVRVIDKWSVSDPTILDSDTSNCGKISLTALSEGKATVTVECSHGDRVVSAKCDVLVTGNSTKTTVNNQLDNPKTGDQLCDGKTGFVVFVGAILIGMFALFIRKTGKAQ